MRKSSRMAHRTVRSTLLRGIALYGLHAAAAHAQTPPPGVPPVSAARPVQDPAQQLIDQQKERARQQELNQPPASIEVPPPTTQQTLDVPPGTPVDQIAESGPVFRVDHIEVSGNTVLPSSKLDAITAPFTGQELGSHRLNVLLKRLTDAFVSAGYVTTRAFVGPQNLESHTLKITVQVGHVEQYTVNGQPVQRLKKDEHAAGGGWLTDAGYENAFPAAPGDPLRLEDLDQGVSQINRLRRNQAEVQILPGQNNT